MALSRYCYSCACRTLDMCRMRARELLLCRQQLLVSHALLVARRVRQYLRLCVLRRLLCRRGNTRMSGVHRRLLLHRGRRHSVRRAQHVERGEVTGHRVPMPAWVHRPRRRAVCTLCAWEFQRRDRLRAVHAVWRGNLQRAKRGEQCGCMSGVPRFLHVITRINHPRRVCVCRGVRVRRVQPVRCMCSRNVL